MIAKRLHGQIVIEPFNNLTIQQLNNYYEQGKPH